MFRFRILILSFAIIGALPIAFFPTALWSGFAATGKCAQQPADWSGLQAALPPARPDAPRLRVTTYNLHAGLGASWHRFTSSESVERRLRAIGEAIAGAAPDHAPIDVVALNEVDFHSRRSAWVDQAAFLAAELHRRTGAQYQVVRGQTWQRGLPGFEVQFGNALLVRH